MPYRRRISESRVRENRMHGLMREDWSRIYGLAIEAPQIESGGNRYAYPNGAVTCPLLYP